MKTKGMERVEQMKAALIVDGYTKEQIALGYAIIGATITSAKLGSMTNRGGMAGLIVGMLGHQHSQFMGTLMAMGSKMLGLDDDRAIVLLDRVDKGFSEAMEIDAQAGVVAEQPKDFAKHEVLGLDRPRSGERHVLEAIFPFLRGR